ncbi:ankyrin repeat domain-containing protein [Methylobacter sp. Wu8]|uniref:Ankyrin repeat protein n=1 Tax=Methylobacter tundripaludum TaxID=173365 RepID=A0A2S6GN48_9GAMM|nr:ankyrin repeat domain-containing protein [Methylobacter tundripaludum]MCK9635581.1 ankyrin repeat domain-containing protein [Methylobacter tundripaludum]PPK66610.1 ankyrin repeat protein [Methylobacter tundripaludum]
MNQLQLIDAAKAGDIYWVQSLIETGEDLEQKDDYGWTALNWAAGCGNLAIVRTLLEAGANAVNSGRDLRTPYRIALAAAQVEVAALLQQAEQNSGMKPESPERPYCKAYPVKAFDSNPVGWQARPALADDAVVYLHQDFSVTTSMWHGEGVLFDRVSDAWQSYCRDILGFYVPTDLELATDYRQCKPQ